MKVYSIILLVVMGVCISPVSAQNSQWCGTPDFDEHMQSLSPQEYSEAMKQYERVQANAQHFLSSKKRSGHVYIIPTVIHVMHDNGVGDISLEQIEDGLRIINEDFRRLNADTTFTRPQFAPYAADCEFEFRLARVDPNGNPTNGVVRVNAPTTAIDADNDVKYTSSGGDDAWPTTQYFNVWLVESIASSGGGTTLGYAQFPYGWGGGINSSYGYVNRNDAWGAIGTSNSDGRTPTHEIGHCLGLYHTFQGGCGSNCSSSGDNICDTPPVYESTWNSSCNPSTNSCSNDMNGSNSPYTSDVVDQTENFMSYDDCQNMFTQGQKAVMHSVVTSVSGLINLTSDANLTATGVNQLIAAKFSADRNVICEGSQVSFTDESFYDQDSWNWGFSGGTPSGSSSSSPTVNYNVPGLYDVSLAVGQGSSSLLSVNKTDYVLVAPSVGLNSPFSENFDNTTNLPNEKWNFQNRSSLYGWELTTSTGYSGNQCVKVKSFNSGVSTFLFNSTSINLSPFISANLSMKIVSGNQANGGNYDYIAVYGSNDCGDSWSKLERKPTIIYSDNSFLTTSFTPADTGEWNSVSLSIPDSMLVSNFLLKFEYESNGRGNNLYIDDLNINGTIGLPQLVYPTDMQEIYDIDPTIDWRAMPDVDSYEYQVDINEYFNSASLESGTKSYISSSDSNSDTEQQLSNLSYDQTYYWRVRAHTDTSVTDWTNTWSFTVRESTSVEEVAKNTFRIFPNPTSGIFTIQKEINAEVQYKVINILGEVILQGNIQRGEKNMHVDCSGFSSGIYFVQLANSESHENFIKKIFLQ